jgi:hypothetical protein
MCLEFRAAEAREDFSGGAYLPFRLLTISTQLCTLRR